MKGSFAGFLLMVFCAFGWEDDPEIILQGALKTAVRQCSCRHPDGSEEKWEEKTSVLVPDEPIVLSRSLLIGGSQVVNQQKVLPFIQLSLDEEFESLLGKRVEIHGKCAKPFHFFDEIQLQVSTALDLDLLNTCQTKTLFYEPNRVELTGILYRKVYPGPPNYTSIEDGDAPECPLFFALTEPVDVELSHPEEEPFNQPHKGVREIQVVFSDERPPEELWNQELTVTGTLSSAHTGHHRRRVLMTATHWEATKRSSLKGLRY